jgi:hypothetical protein
MRKFALAGSSAWPKFAWSVWFQETTTIGGSMRGTWGIRALVVAAVVAAAGVSAIGAASASALPAFFECHRGAVGSGKYSNGRCTTEVEEGRFELQEGIGKGKPFRGKGARSTFYVPEPNVEVTCRAFKEEGQVAAPASEQDLIVTFKGCESLGKPCTTAGAASGTITTFPLEGQLGYISMSPLSVGVALAPESGTDLADWSCEGVEIRTLGSIVFERRGDIDQIGHAWEDVASVTGAGAQTVTGFEGGPRDVLSTVIEGAGPYEAALKATAVDKGEWLEVRG